MKEKYAKMWIKALRSGKYKQTKGKLCVVNGKTVKYCCLGVLCHILKTPYKRGENYKIYDSETNSLPTSVKDETGIRTCFANYGERSDETLIILNDDKEYTFKEIADVIEKNWRKI